MCIVCIEFSKGKLTGVEARRNLGEMLTPYDPHAPEAYALIADAEQAELDKQRQAWEGKDT